MSVPLSVIILTYNEEQNIRNCLESVKDLSDQIFIVDSYSTDKTLEIAREYTNNIYQNPFIDQARQFNWALDNLPIKTEWIMRLDADERLTPELHNEIVRKIPDMPEVVTGLYMKRQVYFMGRWMKHGGYYPIWLLRIFRKGKAICEQKNMDEHIVVLEGKTENLANDIIDENHKGLSFWVDKHNKFASREMMEIMKSGKEEKGQTIKPNLLGHAVQRKRWLKKNLYLKLPLLLRSFFYYIYRYFFKLGFLDGKEGLIFHFLQGFWYRFLVDAKIYEMKKSEASIESLLIPSKSHFVQIKKPVVILETLESNSNLNALKKQFSNAFTRLSIADDFNKANSVFIKPNLGYPVYKKGVTTRKEFIEGLIAALREINNKTMIYIGEGEGGYNSFSMNEAFKNMGFYDLEKKYPNVRIINLSKTPSQDVAINTPKGTCNLDLPKIFFEEIDFSISCPVPKVHCMTGVSLSYKNQWGCLPDAMRLKDHYILDHIVSKISHILKFKYAFLDGKYGLNINGPMVGDPVEVNWFAASNSLGAFDTVVSEMMGFDWREIKHLMVTSDYGFIPKREDISIIGDIGSLKKQFVLKRDFWNYPALAAFNSKKITHLVYFSRLAKLLHDIMYTFRKRPIEDKD
jgi:uncharacterized protein (DUF362 family)